MGSNPATLIWAAVWPLSPMRVENQTLYTLSDPFVQKLGQVRAIELYTVPAVPPRPRQTALERFALRRERKQDGAPECQSQVITKVHSYSLTDRTLDGYPLVSIWCRFPCSTRETLANERDSMDDRLRFLNTAT